MDCENITEMENQFRIGKAWKKARNVLEKYGYDWFTIIEYEPIYKKFALLKRLAKHLRFKIVPYK